MKAEVHSRKKSSIFTVPNILSFLRLLMIPFFVWLYIQKQDYVSCGVVLILSGLTDMVDGYIARHFHQITDLGKALDPVADKLTQIFMLFCLCTTYPKMWVPVILLIVKEISAGLFNLIIFRRKKEVHGAVWHGKVTTALLYSMLILHVFWVTIPPVLSNLLVGACVLMMLLSLLLYTKRYIGILKEKNQGAEQE